MNVVTSGTVLGAKPTDIPDRVTEILGPDFADNPLQKRGTPLLEIPHVQAPQYRTY
ncbi:hypothetical protein ABZ543_31830 [Streptomyces roseifaciens]